MKIGLNEEKTSIFLRAENISLIQNYFFFTEIKDIKEVHKIDKLFKQFDTFEEANEFLNDLADKDDNENGMEASIIDGQVLMLTFKGKIFKKNYSFDIILYKGGISKDQVLIKLVQKVNDLSKKNEFLEKYVRGLRNKVT